MIVYVQVVTDGMRLNDIQKFFSPDSVGAAVTKASQLLNYTTLIPPNLKLLCRRVSSKTLPQFYY